MAGGTEFLRSPRQASQIFGLEGVRAPRQKNLFVVNFRKAGDSASTGLASSSWNKDLGFLVKSVDRPTIDPKTEELNQYNKKRIIHTGYKIGTTRLSFYDTADSMAMRMWAEYSKYYFGDFRHAKEASTDWSYDVTLSEFKDTAKAGYGFAPIAASNSASDYNSQFFFETVSIYQVFGGNYIRMDLIHPKISSFAPDSLDYSASDVGTYTATLNCEAVVYLNDAQPRPLEEDAFLAEAFGSIEYFNGDVMEVPPADAVAGFTYPEAVFMNGYAAPLGFTNQIAPTSVPADLRMYVNSTSTGTLNSYGAYNFGSLGGQQVASARSTTTDLTVSALNNGALASALALSSSVLRPSTEGIPMVTLSNLPSYIAQDKFDAARAAVEVTGGGLLAPGQERDPDMRAIIDAATYAAMSVALSLGSSEREQIYNRHIPQGEHVNTWNSASGTQGVALNPVVCGIMNGQRSPSSQIGFNARNTTPAPPAGTDSREVRRETLATDPTPPGAR